MNAGADPIPDPVLLIAEARDAIAQGASPNWAQLLERLAASMPRTNFAPSATVTAIQELLVDETFLGLSDSWRLMHFLLHNWKWIHAEHKLALRETIADSFDRFSNWMGAFIVGEILGEHYCDEWAMDRLAALARSAQMPARSLVPHGLESLARGTQVEKLRLSAVETMRTLTKDVEPTVRDEAVESLRKVGEPPGLTQQQ